MQLDKAAQQLKHSLEMLSAGGCLLTVHPVLGNKNISVKKALGRASPRPPQDAMN